MGVVRQGEEEGDVPRGDVLLDGARRTRQQRCFLHLPLRYRFRPPRCILLRNSTGQTRSEERPRNVLDAGNIF